MNKKITTLLIFINVVALALINLLGIDKGLIYRISILLTASLSLLISLLLGLKKKKNGMIWGLVIGITIASISSIIHYYYATEYFKPLFLRTGIIILSGGCGGIIGVNKKY